jgi:uncharacterized membrane protein YozB (DUF420 family)
MRIFRVVGFLLLIILAVPLAINGLSYLNLDFDYRFLKLKQHAIATGWYLPAYYSHVLIASIILLVGIFQINTPWQQRWPMVHRSLGKVYVFGVLCFAAPGGFVMSLFIQRGEWVLASFILQGIAWIVSTYLAYHYIKKKEIQLHRNWMWRSYSITLAAITLRAYVFMSSWSLELSQPAAYATIAWLSWVPNLLVCELYIWIKDRAKVSTV